MGVWVFIVTYPVAQADISCVIYPYLNFMRNWFGYYDQQQIQQIKPVHKSLLSWNSYTKACSPTQKLGHTSILNRNVFAKISTNRNKSFKTLIKNIKFYSITKIGSGNPVLVICQRFPQEILKQLDIDYRPSLAWLQKFGTL